MIMSGDFVVRGHFQSNDVKAVLERVPGNNGDLCPCREDIGSRAPFHIVCIERHPHFLGKRRCTAARSSPNVKMSLRIVASTLSTVWYGYCARTSFLK